MGYQIVEIENREYCLLLDQNAQRCTLDDAAGFAARHKFAAVELRGVPYDTERHFDPVTQQGDSVGGAAVLIERKTLDAVGGLDPDLPPAAAMADLSARLRSAGARMGYDPFAVVECEPKQGLEQYLDTVYGRYLLTCKFGTAQQRRDAFQALLQVIRSPKHFPGVRKALLRGLPAVMRKAGRLKRYNHLSLKDVLENRELRGSCRLTPFTQAPLVSVVIRTHKRKEVLRRTLQCLYWQTYKNFEIVVIEDGEETAGEMIRKDFAGLNIRYFNTGAPVGRGRAGNIGIEKSRGEYVCFLDDDDYYYPDYIELNLARMLESGAELILSSIMAFEIDVHSRDPFSFDIKKIYPVIFDHLNLLDMCVKCRVPMTGAMFLRSLYDRVGGMREDIDGDEDWAMWLRYWKVARRIDDTKPDIPRAVSMFGYPADPEAARRRLAAYEVYDRVMLSDPGLCYTIPAEKLKDLIRQQKKDLAHLYRIGSLQQLLETRKAEDAWTPAGEGETMLVTAKQLNGLYHALLCAAAQQLQQGTLLQWLEKDDV